LTVIDALACAPLPVTPLTAVTVSEWLPFDSSAAEEDDPGVADVLHRLAQRDGLSLRDGVGRERRRDCEALAVDEADVARADETVAANSASTRTAAASNHACESDPRMGGSSCEDWAISQSDLLRDTGCWYFSS